VDPTRQAPIPDEQVINRRNCGGYFFIFFFLFCFYLEGGIIFSFTSFAETGNLDSYGKRENVLRKPFARLLGKEGK
jgi:hypothetical protein